MSTSLPTIRSPLDSRSIYTLNQLDTAMAQDCSSAKPQLQKHASSTATQQRKRASRVSKTSSAGNSPQNYQRRRHTTSQTIPRQRRAIYQQCLQTPPSSTPLMNSARPVSWHPSSVAYQQQQQYPSYTTNFSHGIPTPMAYPTSTLAPNRPWYNIEDPSGFYQQSADYDCRNLNVNTPNPSQFFTNNYTQASNAVFSPVLYPSSATLGNSSTYKTYTAPATPEFIAAEAALPAQRPMLSRTNSKELVGMGLYDGPDRNSWTLDNYMESGDNTTRPVSLGKGLKLEAAWEPPEEEDKTDDEDDDEEAEDQEQVEETIQQQLEHVVKEAPQLPPIETDGQSFFYTSQGQMDNPQHGFVQYTMPSYGMVL